LVELIRAPKLGRKYLRNGIYSLWFAFDALLARQRRVPRLRPSEAH